MIGGRWAANNWRRAKFAAGGGGKLPKLGEEGFSRAAHRNAMNSGSKRIRNTGIGAGVLLGANSLRSPSGSGSEGMMPMSSGGMTGY